MTTNRPVIKEGADSLSCRYGFKRGMIGPTPLGRDAKLLQLRPDEQWDAEYLEGYIHLTQTVLNPKLLNKAKWGFPADEVRSNSYTHLCSP